MRDIDSIEFFVVEIMQPGHWNGVFTVYSKKYDCSFLVFVHQRKSAGTIVALSMIDSDIIQ